jgi:CRP-like cAMP-binding protein
MRARDEVDSRSHVKGAATLRRDGDGRRTIAQDTGNRILDALPRHDFDGIHPHLQEVPLPFKQSIHHAGDEIAQIYLPVAGMVSVVATLQDGSSVEVGTVGEKVW